MSVELVESEIRRFLYSDEPEVICITGRWGVGKTFAWNRYVQDAKKTGRIALKHYAYVSLFGINSLDDLKFAVFENLVRSADIGIEPSIETLQSHTAAATKGFVHRLIGAAQNLRFVENYIGGAPPLLFSFIRKAIVCFDDFERRGKDLSVRDVLGLINNLKEVRKCKVCLILNDEELEHGQEEFQKYFERVVDTTLKFTPSPTECARIALSGKTESDKWLADNCTQLGVSNIRVIKKIERAVNRVKPIVEKYDSIILKQAVHSLTLFGWSMFEPTMAPRLDFIEKKQPAAFLDLDGGKESLSQEEASWQELLSKYQFTLVDEFDAALLVGLRNGFFDAALVARLAEEKDRKIKAGSLDAAFVAAWNKFHESFDNNEEEVLTGLSESFQKGVKYIAPMNLSSTVSLFKQFGKTDQALEMLNYYIESRSTEAGIFDLQNFPFSDFIKDPDVLKAFKEKYVSFKQEELDPAAILLRIADTSSWNPEDIQTLSELSVDGYCAMFKSIKGYDLRKIIKTSLQFGDLEGHGAQYKTISTKAKEALKLIGQESQINALRVKAWAIDVEGKPS